MLVAALAAGQKSDPAEVLLKAAMQKELVDGDLKAAIEQYKKIVARPGGNRVVAAKALLQIGRCYEKLGKAEARKAYEQILRDYADQRELVAAARARLSALGQPAGGNHPSGMVVRRIGRASDSTGAPTPDGRSLTCVDWETGDLALWDLATGDKRRLTNKGSWFDSSEYAEFSTVSPDGKQVAYAWFSKEKRYEIRLIGLDGSGQRVLYGNENRQAIWLRPADWSPDGKQILALFRGQDAANRIVFVSVTDGALQVLKTLDWRYPLKMGFSPDGRYIAYDFPPKEELPERDIFLLSTDGSREIPLVQHRANDFLLGWAPDGQSVLFSSDRTGTWSAWVMRVMNGAPQGSPLLVKQDIGLISPVRFTRKGSYLYTSLTRTQDVYMATLDMATGKLLSPPAAASQRLVGSNHWPEWSPDGKYLAFVSQLLYTDENSPVLSILSLETGKQRDLFPPLKYFSRLRWSPDGRSILVNGVNRGNRGGLYQIDVQTGAVTTLVQSSPADGAYPRQAAWSPNGKTIFYSHYTGPILWRDLESGLEKVICPGAAFALSPDGRWLAVHSEDQAAKMSVLKLFPVAGGEPRELLRLPVPGAFTQGLAWTPEGRYLLFGRAGVQEGQARTELWRIPVAGGEPEKLGLSGERMVEFRVHPDGRRVAFTAGAPKAELWVMENFLPVLKAAR